MGFEFSLFNYKILIIVIEWIDFGCMHITGGNSKTAMIAAISPADINYDETMSTLRYAKCLEFFVSEFAFKSLFKGISMWYY